MPEGMTHRAIVFCGRFKKNCKPETSVSLWVTASQAAEKMSCFVILSEVKNLSSI